MIQIPPAPLYPNPRPVEEIPASPIPAESAESPDAGALDGGKDLLATLGALFGLHPDVKGAADPTRYARATREYAQGEALFKAGRYADALEHFEKAQQAVPASANLYSQGACLERLGRHEEAAKRFEAYVAAVPDADDAAAVKAHAAALHTEARGLAREAYDRGTTALSEKRFGDAARAFSEARDHFPSPEATYMVAKSLDLAGANAMATVKEYQRYLNEAPGADDAKAVRDRIHALLEATGNELIAPE